MFLVVVLEMWNFGFMVFVIGLMLIIGVVEVMEKYVFEDLKVIYLEKLVFGEWMGIMNFIEL